MIENITIDMNDDYYDGTPLKEEWPDYLPEIYIPIYSANLRLYEGFWYLYNGYRYHHMFFPPGTQWQRYDVFDIVRALGQKEAWYCSEYEIEDAVGPENYTLESWLEKAFRSPHGITEYNLDELIREGDAIWDTYKEYYHDTYSDVFPFFDKVAEQLAPKHLLGLSCALDKMLRVEDDGKVISVPPPFQVR